MSSLKIPNHLGIILDGNGRWAKKRAMPRTFGHKMGLKSLEKTIKAAIELNIRVLTLFAFSTENWDRPKEEVDTIFSLIDSAIDENFEKIQTNNIKVRVSGDITKLDKSLQDKINNLIEKTKFNNGLILNVLLNYGFRSEILMAVNNLLEKHEQKVTNSQLENELYSAGLPDIDLVIRTGKEQRLSNFMMYQCAYSELYFTKVFWPDFNKKLLVKAIKEYSKRDRRFGKV